MLISRMYQLLLFIWFNALLLIWIYMQHNIKLRTCRWLMHSKTFLEILCRNSAISYIYLSFSLYTPQSWLMYSMCFPLYRLAQFKPAKLCTHWKYLDSTEVHKYTHMLCSKILLVSSHWCVTKCTYTGSSW